MVIQWACKCAQAPANLTAFIVFKVAKSVDRLSSLDSELPVAESPV